MIKFYKGLLLLLLHYFCSSRYIFRNPDVTAHYGPLADGYPAQDGGIGINDDIVFQNGVTGDAFYGVPILIQWETFGSQRNSLV